ncbi:MAG: hypothetical protein WBA46_03935 [Thermomicrobiales bacterium]
MTDRKPIFGNDDSVQREIEANEARDRRPEEPTVERAIDRFLSPIADIVKDNALTPEEAAAVDRENEQRRNRN